MIASPLNLHVKPGEKLRVSVLSPRDAEIDGPIVVVDEETPFSPSYGPAIYMPLDKAEEVARLILAKIKAYKQREDEFRRAPTEIVKY